MVFGQCAFCNVGVDSEVFVCSGGCGGLGHLQCFRASPSEHTDSTFDISLCIQCRVKTPRATCELLLRRLTELTTVVYNQNTVIAEVKCELLECKSALDLCISELSSTKSELSQLKSSMNVRKLSTMFESGTPRKRSNSLTTQSSRITPTEETVVISQTDSNNQQNSGIRIDSRTHAFKRRRRDYESGGNTNTSDNVIIGTMIPSSEGIPTVEPIVQAKVFISRISPTVKTSKILSSIQPNIKSTLTVHKLKTKYDTYSSFCLVCAKEDSSFLLNPGNWQKGTLIMPYDKPLPRRVIIESLTQTNMITDPFIGGNHDSRFVQRQDQVEEHEDFVDCAQMSVPVDATTPSVPAFPAPDHLNFISSQQS